MSSNRTRAGALVLIVLLTIVAYAPAIRAPLLFDDTTTIDHNSSLATLWPPATPLHPPAESPVAGRPVANLSLAVNHAVNDVAGIDQSPDPGGPDKTISYHLVNLAIHIAAGLLLFGIVRRTLRSGRGTNGWTDRADSIALLISALWLLHPIQTEAVNYLSQRSELLVSLCYLATLYASIRAWDAAAASDRYRWYAIGVVSCLLGMGSKEVMVSAPLMIVLYDRAFRLKRWREVLSLPLRSRRWFYGALVATLLLLLFLAGANPRSTSAGFATRVTPLEYLITQGWAIPHYLMLSFWPNQLAIDYGQQLIPIGTALPGLFLLGALAIVTLTAWSRADRWAWLGFCGAWFFCLLAPSSSIVPVATEVAAERRIYLALAAVIVVAVIGADQLLRRLSTRSPSSRTMQRGMAIAIVALLAVLTFRRSTEYRRPDMLWGDAIAVRPENARAWNNLGSVLADQVVPREADADSLFAHAVHLDSAYVPALGNLASSRIRQRRFAEAEELLARVASIAPNDERALVQLGGLMLMRGDAASAIPILRRAESLAPEDSDARTLLASAMARVQQPQQ